MKKQLWFWGVVGALIVGWAAVWLCYWRYIEYTDDAYVQGNQVYITPLHAGFVTTIHTDDSFLVEKGQLLVELDRTDALIALERAKEQLGQTVREVCEQFHLVDAYRAQIALNRAVLIKATQDALHRKEVVRAQGVSIEEYEHVLAALKAEQAGLEKSVALYYQTLALVQHTSVQGHPRVVAAADLVRDMWVRLYRCKIYAPVTGLVAQRTIQVGMWVPEGELLMSVIPLDQIWVNANYKETQLKGMRLGQSVDLTVDLWGLRQIFHGKIVGLPGGAGNAFSLLPPQNLSGNWIKIVQRLPVRVALDPEEIRAHPLRVGLSCRAVVDVRHQTGLVVPETSAGSPLYETSIFEQEEKGDQELIHEVIAANFDPQLAAYLSAPLEPTPLPFDMAQLLEEARHVDEELHREVAETPW